MELLRPGDKGWDEARLGFNLAIDPQPALISVPRDEDDVVETVCFARKEGLRVAAQGTAHGAGALGSLSDSILLRTTAMKGVELGAAARTAKARAGAVWADLVPQASEQSLAALHGSAPNLGIVGYTIGGGVGWYSRKHGLACNRATGFEIVGADGELRRVNASSDPDLFWALRGGGGSFGVVTSVEFELLEIPEVYAGALFFPFERAEKVLRAWRDWTAGVPDEMTSVGRLMQFPPIPDLPEPLRGKSFAILELIFIGDEANGKELVAPLIDLGPEMNTVTVVPPAGIAGLHMDPPAPVSGVSEHMLLEDLGDEPLNELLRVAGPGSGSKLTSVEVRHGGGALSRPDPDSGALASLPGTFNMYAVGSTMDPATKSPTRDPAAKAAIVDRLDQLKVALEPFEAGRYMSFCGQPTDFEAAFSAETCNRLRAVKAKHDPDNLFHANQELG